MDPLDRRYTLHQKQWEEFMTKVQSSAELPIVPHFDVNTLITAETDQIKRLINRR
ncbi:unnamed protein product, partial [Notodromas monacha]